MHIDTMVASIIYDGKNNKNLTENQLTSKFRRKTSKKGENGTNDR